MDMKVDSTLIKTQREQRAWSQEHLAEVTGLGLRTIQRIETTGAASFESARSLAAVFGLDVAELRVDAEPRRSRVVWNPSRLALSAVAACLAGGALFFAANGSADQVLLDVGVSLKTPNEVRQWMTQMVVDEGSLVPDVNDLRLEELHFSIVPKLLPDGRILLEIKVFQSREGNDVLVTEPRLVTGDGELAEIAFTVEPYRNFRFSITPRRH